MGTPWAKQGNIKLTITIVFICGKDFCLLRNDFNFLYYDEWYICDPYSSFLWSSDYSVLFIFSSLFVSSLDTPSFPLDTSNPCSCCLSSADLDHLPVCLTTMSSHRYTFHRCLVAFTLTYHIYPKWLKLNSICIVFLNNDKIFRQLFHRAFWSHLMCHCIYIF